MSGTSTRNGRDIEAAGLGWMWGFERASASAESSDSCATAIVAALVLVAVPVPSVPVPATVATVVAVVVVLTDLLTDLAPCLAPLITAIRISIILHHFAMMIWSRNPLAYPQIVKTQMFHVGGATITNVQITIIVMCVLLMAGLALLVYRTKLGTAMRATAQNPQIAGLMGVDVNRIIASTFVIGAALAAVAGVMVASYYGIAHYTMGANLGLKAFAAAVLGGIGNLPGTMLGGVLLR